MCGRFLLSKNLSLHLSLSARNADYVVAALAKGAFLLMKHEMRQCHATTVALMYATIDLAMVGAPSRPRNDSTGFGEGFGFDDDRALLKYCLFLRYRCSQGKRLHIRKDRESCSGKLAEKS